MPRLNKSALPRVGDTVQMSTDTPDNAKLESAVESPDVSVHCGHSAPCVVSPDARLWLMG